MRLTGTTTLGQNGLGSNCSERVPSKSPKLEPHHLMPFSVISRTPQFLWVTDIIPMTQGELFFIYITGRDLMISEKHTILYIMREC